MNRRTVCTFVVVMMSVLTVALATSVRAETATAYSFNLITPNTAMAPSGDFAGDTIRVTGSGAFDTAGTVVGSGSFQHIKPDGTVFARGTWVATGFVSFRSFGGPNGGTQGGVLVITVTLMPVGGSPHPGISMTVNCLVNKPAAFTGEEGTAVDGFTERTGGETLFHITT